MPAPDDELERAVEWAYALDVPDIDAVLDSMRSERKGAEATRTLTLLNALFQGRIGGPSVTDTIPPVFIAELVDPKMRTDVSFYRKPKHAYVGAGSAIEIFNSALSELSHPDLDKATGKRFMRGSKETVQAVTLPPLIRNRLHDIALMNGRSVPEEIRAILLRHFIEGAHTRHG